MALPDYHTGEPINKMGTEEGEGNYASTLSFDSVRNETVQGLTQPPETQSSDTRRYIYDPTISDEDYEAIFGSQASEPLYPFYRDLWSHLFNDFDNEEEYESPKNGSKTASPSREENQPSRKRKADEEDEPARKRTKTASHSPEEPSAFGVDDCNVGDFEIDEAEVEVQETVENPEGSEVRESVESPEEAGVRESIEHAEENASRGAGGSGIDNDLPVVNQSLRAEVGRSSRTSEPPASTTSTRGKSTSRKRPAPWAPTRNLGPNALQKSASEEQIPPSTIVSQATTALKKALISALSTACNQDAANTVSLKQLQKYLLDRAGLSAEVVEIDDKLFIATLQSMVSDLQGGMEKSEAGTTGTIISIAPGLSEIYSIGTVKAPEEYQARVSELKKMVTNVPDDTTHNKLQSGFDELGDELKKGLKLVEAYKSRNGKLEKECGILRGEKIKTAQDLHNASMEVERVKQNSQLYNPSADLVSLRAAYEQLRNESAAEIDKLREENHELQEMAREYLDHRSLDRSASASDRSIDQSSSSPPSSDENDPSFGPRGEMGWFCTLIDKETKLQCLAWNSWKARTKEKGLPAHLRNNCCKCRRKCALKFRTLVTRESFKINGGMTQITPLPIPSAPAPAFDPPPPAGFAPLPAFAPHLAGFATPPGFAPPPGYGSGFGPRYGPGFAPPPPPAFAPAPVPAVVPAVAPAKRGRKRKAPDDEGVQHDSPKKAKTLPGFDISSGTKNSLRRAIGGPQRSWMAAPGDIVDLTGEGDGEAEVDAAFEAEMLAELEKGE